MTYDRFTPDPDNPDGMLVSGPGIRPAKAQPDRRTGPTAGEIEAFISAEYGKVARVKKVLKRPDYWEKK